MKAIKFESDRLIYEPLNTSFVSKNYVDWMNDEEVNKYLESGGDYSTTKLENFLTDVEKRDILFWAISVKSSNKHIGNIKIDPINARNKTGEYGILIGDKHEWGRGYAKEATSRVLEYSFTEVGLRKVTLGVVEDNIAAEKLYEKLGFVKDGFLRAHSYHIDKWCNVIRMSIFNPALK